MTREEELALAADANRAPSVHNIQPARFRFETDSILVLEDRSRRLWIGDPEGKDNEKSLGAASEGLVLALSERGKGAIVEETQGPRGEAAAKTLREVARVRLTGAAQRDGLAPYAATRASYRGAFARPDNAARAALERVGEVCPDLRLVSEGQAIAQVATMFDAASMRVLRERDYRGELVSWLRLRQSHPAYRRDGLSSEHMALSEFGALGAGLVMGKAFSLLDRLGLAAPLLAESAKVKGAAGIGLFHRPRAEPEFDTGRRFYRVWLEIERQGLALCPMSVLADLPDVATHLLDQFKVGGERKLVTVFRIGQRPPSYRQPPRARLPAEELLV